METKIVIQKLMEQTVCFQKDKQDKLSIVKLSKWKRDDLD